MTGKSDKIKPFGPGNYYVVSFKGHHFLSRRMFILFRSPYSLTRVFVLVLHYLEQSSIKHFAVQRLWAGVELMIIELAALLWVYRCDFLTR